MINLENIGNVEGYTHEPRTARAEGILLDERLALKLYSMVKQNPPAEEKIREVIEIRDNKIQNQEISPLIGMGFMILSEDMLNVARWDDKYPIVLKNQIYEFKEGDLKTLNPLELKEAGSFCMWELGIVNHEKQAWKKYLCSQRNKKDKEEYLDNFYYGERL
jgi:hypothetical protein